MRNDSISETGKGRNSGSLEPKKGLERTNSVPVGLNKGANIQQQSSRRGGRPTQAAGAGAQQNQLKLGTKSTSANQRAAGYNPVRARNQQIGQDRILSARPADNQLTTFAPNSERNRNAA